MATLERHGSGRFALVGDLDAIAVAELLRGAPPGATGEDAPAEAIQIDLHGVGRVDSAALGLVVAWARQAARQGRQVSLCAAPENLIALARVSNLDQVLGLDRPCAR